MLDFEPFSLQALKKAFPYIKNGASPCSDLSAGYLYLWHEGTDVRFCVWKGTLVIRQIIGEQPAFTYPMGNDPGGMIDELIAYAHDNGLPLRFFAVDEKTLEKIRRDDRLSPFMCAYDRRWSDYVYSFREAMTFSGGKYSGQRNHINKFKKLYGEPRVRLLTPEDRPEAEALLAAYGEEHRDGGLLEKTELERTAELFDVSGELDLIAAGLFVDGRLAALSIGEVSGDTLLIHTEKALTRYEGIYPTMYSSFVRLAAEVSGRPLEFINREDDSGDPGLRTSKLQYHPLALVHKRLVHVRTPALRFLPGTVLESEKVALTDLRETDKEAYMRLNTDRENNRFWGYDYLSDPGITLPVTEDTFYDSVTYDMRAGDSVNLAVRETAEGEMIGEAVIWNFTSDGRAEIGCRIFPDFQGKGYGAAAFGLAADHAERQLGVKALARCFNDNVPSFRMISANGFLPVKRDDEFIWFERP